jgi:hypothetical protein
MIDADSIDAHLAAIVARLASLADFIYGVLQVSKGLGW